MAWNGSDRARPDFKVDNIRQACLHPKKSKLPLILWMLLGVALLGIVAVVAHILSSESVSRAGSHKIRSREVAFSRVAQSNQVCRKRNFRNSTNKVEITKVLFEPKAHIVHERIHTNGTVSVSFEERIFQCPSDQKIAALLLSEPGACVAGDPSGLYDDFDKDFVESLLSSIAISPDDCDEVKQLKLAVIEVREDMKRRKQNGENLQKVMEESWYDLRRLGEYKESIENELQGCALDTSYTAQDIDDFIEAANIMLRDKGCSPLSNESIIREFAKYRIERALEATDDRECNEEY